MRTHYESEQDRQKQRFVAKIFADAFGLTIKEIEGEKSFQDVEFFMEGELFAVAEIKCRTANYGIFRLFKKEGFMVSKSKYDRLKEIKHTRSLFIFAVNVDLRNRTYEGIYFKTVLPTDAYPEKLKGRTRQTRDEWDKELCTFIPLDEFQRLD